MSKEILNEKFKQINFLFTALVTGQVLVFAIAYWLVSSGRIEFNTAANELFRYIVPLFGIIMMLISKLVYNKKIQTGGNNLEIENKLEEYKASKILVWAMIESAGLFSIVIFMITGNFFYAVVFLLLLGYFLLNKPGRENFMSDFNIPKDESSKILR